MGLLIYTETYLMSFQAKEANKASRVILGSKSVPQDNLWLLSNHWRRSPAWVAPCVRERGSMARMPRAGPMAMAAAKNKTRRGEGLLMEKGL